MTTSTTTLKAHHEAATEARRKATEAAERAAAAERNAEQAAAKAREESDARLRRDAERCLASFDRDRAACEERMVQARDAFNRQAATAESFTDLRGLYLAWSDGAADSYWLYRSLASACGRLGKSTYQNRAIPSFSDHAHPPVFSVALDAALARVVQQRNADIEDAAQQRILDIESGEIDE